MERQLKASGVPYERFPAVNAKDVKSGKFGAILNRTGLDPELGADPASVGGTIGCALSHRLLYEKILKEDPGSMNAYMVMEDDAVLPPGWVDRINRLLPQVPADAVVVNAGSFGRIRCEDVVSEELALATWPFRVGYDYFYSGSAGLLLFPATLPALVDALHGQPLHHADVAILSKGAVRTYNTLEHLVELDWNLASQRTSEDGRGELALSSRWSATSGRC